MYGSNRALVKPESEISTLSAHCRLLCSELALTWQLHVLRGKDCAAAVLLLLTLASAARLTFACKARKLFVVFASWPDFCLVSAAVECHGSYLLGARLAFRDDFDAFIPRGEFSHRDFLNALARRL